MTTNSSTQQEDPHKVLLGGKLKRPRLQALHSGKFWRCEVTYYPRSGTKGERRWSSTHRSREEAAVAMESFLETFNVPRRLPSGTTRASIPPRPSLRETAIGRKKTADVAREAATTSAVFATKPTVSKPDAYKRVKRELRWPRLTLLHYWQTHKDLKHVRKLEDIPRRRLRLHCEFGAGGSTLAALSSVELDHLRYLMLKADLLRRQRAEDAKHKAEELMSRATSKRQSLRTPSYQRGIKRGGRRDAVLVQIRARFKPFRR